MDNPIRVIIENVRFSQMKKPDPENELVSVVYVSPYLRVLRRARSPYGGRGLGADDFDTPLVSQHFGNLFYD